MITAQQLRLSQEDREKRFEMCEWLGRLSDEELNNIAFTDEANFYLGKNSKFVSSRMNLILLLFFQTDSKKRIFFTLKLKIDVSIKKNYVSFIKK